MKRFFSLLLVTICLITASTGCRKCDQSGREVVDVTLHANERYSYSLGSFGDEEGATISRQAAHYAESRLERQSDFSTIYYYYQPALDYVGQDEVELKSERGSNGASANDRITYVTLRFTVVR
jgi:hypothetical protein